MTAADIERDSHRRARELFPFPWTNYAEMQVSRRLFITAYSEGYLEGATRMNRECTELVAINLRYEKQHGNDRSFIADMLSSLMKLMRSRVPTLVDEKWD